MDPMVPNGSAKGDNTKLPSRCSPSIHWGFTLNNWSKSDLGEILDICGSKCSKYIIQSEVGECGTPHLQGGIKFPTKIRPMSLFSNKSIHWEAIVKHKGGWEGWVQYCSKAETWTGERWTNIHLPKPLKKQELWADWHHDLMEELKADPDDRSINWFVDLEGGKGKTSFARHMADYHGDRTCVISATKSADILTMVEEHYEVYIIDIPRCAGEFCPYNALEQIKNGLVTDAKLKKKAKVTRFNPPHVIVFANHEPSFDKMSADRWVLRHL